MNFRSSTYLQKYSTDIQDMTWYEAHKTHEGYVIAQLNGNPRSVGRPDTLTLSFSSSAQDTTKPKTLPASSVFLTTAPDAKEALEVVFAYEDAELVKGSRLVDIGDARMGGIEHYAAFMSKGKLPLAPLPEKLVEAADSFVWGLRMKYLLGGAPRGMMEGASRSLQQYQKLPTAALQQ